MNLSPEIIWAALGFILLIIEMFTLSFVVIFFGIAALVVAAIKASTGLSNITAELFIFAGVGGACLLFFRKKLRKAFLNRGEVASDTATVMRLSADIAPHQSEKIEYQGALWDATNDSDVPLKRGDKVVIVRTESIKLIVRPFAERS